MIILETSRHIIQTEMISTEISQCSVAPFRRSCRTDCRRWIKTNNNAGAGDEADRSAGILQSRWLFAVSHFRCSVLFTIKERWCLVSLLWWDAAANVRRLVGNEMERWRRLAWWTWQAALGIITLGTSVTALQRFRFNIRRPFRSSIHHHSTPLKVFDRRDGKGTGSEGQRRDEGNDHCSNNPRM